MNQSNINFKKAKVLSIASGCIITIFTVFIFSAWATKKSMTKTGSAESIVDIIMTITASLPSHISGVVKMLGHFSPPKGVNDIYCDVKPVASKSDQLNGFLLTPFINERGENIVSLHNVSTLTVHYLYTNSVDYKTKITDELFGSNEYRQLPISSRRRITSPVLSEKGTLTYIIQYNDMVSIDLLNHREIWRVKGAFHHSLEKDYDGSVWACASIMSVESINTNAKNHKYRSFEDNSIVKVSNKGLIEKSLKLSQLISRSGLEYLQYGLSDSNHKDDPYHLNQVTPLTGDIGLLRKGRVLVSLRNISTIALIDVETEKIIWHKTGPWMKQHSVIPFDESSVVVLDNHSSGYGDYWINPDWQTRVMRYNINSDSLVELNFQTKSLPHLKIPIGGRIQKIGQNKWMLEHCLQGTVFLFDNDELVFKWSNNYSRDTVGVSSWCKFVTESEFSTFKFN